MRHGIRRTSEMIALALLALHPWEGATATAQTANAALRGDYNMTVNTFCLAANSTGTSNQERPIALRGTLSFNGAGNGTFSGQSLSPALDPSNPAGAPPNGHQANVNCTGTYAVNADGTFSQQMNCGLTFTAGLVIMGGVQSLVGATATLNGVQLQGQLSLDGTVLLLSDTTPNIETFTWTSGPLNGQSETRECNGSGLATSRR